jgi:hypothetical protein
LSHTPDTSGTPRNTATDRELQALLVLELAEAPAGESGFAARALCRLAGDELLRGERAQPGLARVIDELVERAADLGSWGVVSLRALDGEMDAGPSRELVESPLRASIFLGALAYKALTLARGHVPTEIDEGPERKLTSPPGLPTHRGPNRREDAMKIPADMADRVAVVGSAHADQRDQGLEEIGELVDGYTVEQLHDGFRQAVVGLCAAMERLTAVAWIADEEEEAIKGLARAVLGAIRALGAAERRLTGEMTLIAEARSFLAVLGGRHANPFSGGDGSEFR